MNNEYNILSKEWNGKPRTVLSYTKQIKLYKEIIKQYPTPSDLKKKLLSMDNSNSQILGYYINENWSDEHYKKFILANIIKYTNIGKFIISNLIGATAGIISGYSLNKYLWSDSKKDEDIKKVIEASKTLPPDQLDDYYNQAIKDNYAYHNSKYDMLNPKVFGPYAFGIGTKGLTSYGTYKLLDTIDKKNAKKNA